MTLIAIVLAMLLERMLSYSPKWRAHDLTGHWMNWIDGLLGAQRWSLALYLVPPVAVVALVYAYLGDLPAGVLLQLPLSMLVLIACLGPRDLREEVHAYEKAVHRGDEEDARSRLRQLLNGPRRRPDNDLDRSPVAACFVQAHERWFAVLLWFFFFGPSGAVAYRVIAAVSCHLRENAAAEESRQLAEWLHGVMAWPSARVTALSFALAGSADHAYNHWRRWSLSYTGSWTQDAWPLLATVGVASLAQDPDQPSSQLECLDSTLSLLTRSLLLFLAVLALLTIAGWLA